MQRLGMVLQIKPEAIEKYKEYHRKVWPEVLRTITQCNIHNYSIFAKDDLLFAYMEYYGEDRQADWAKMAADPKTQEWWSIMEPMQQPLATRKPGEWWAEMENVFHVE